MRIRKNASETMLNSVKTMKPYFSNRLFLACVQWYVSIHVYANEVIKRQEFNI